MSLTKEEFKRYSRHLLIPEVGRAGQEKLKAASVLVVGTGGLGSPVALYLAAAGVGRIGIVDYDVVDDSNLQRQVIHSTAWVGKPKVDSARQRMLELNPYIRVDAYNELFTCDSARDIAEPYSILVDGTDNFATRYLINDLCVLTKKIYVYGSIFRFEGQVSVFDAQKGPCYRCLFPEPPPPDLVPTCAEAGVFGILPGTIGTLQASEVIKLILGIGEPLVGSLLLYDALEMNTQKVKLRKNPHCKICGPQPVVTGLIDYDQFCRGELPGAPVELAPSWQVDPRQAAERLQRGEPLHLLDVRAPVEQQVSFLPGATLIPEERLEDELDQLDPTLEWIVFCRTGVRSARAVALLHRHGFSLAKNLLGGINAWARDVDPSLPEY